LFAERGRRVRRRGTGGGDDVGLGRAFAEHLLRWGASGDEVVFRRKTRLTDQPDYWDGIEDALEKEFQLPGPQLPVASANRECGVEIPKWEFRGRAGGIWDPSTLRDGSLSRSTCFAQDDRAVASFQSPACFCGLGFPLGILYRLDLHSGDAVGFHFFDGV